MVRRLCAELDPTVPSPGLLTTGDQLVIEIPVAAVVGELGGQKVQSTTSLSALCNM